MVVRYSIWKGPVPGLIAGSGADGSDQSDHRNVAEPPMLAPEQAPGHAYSTCADIPFGEKYGTSFAVYSPTDVGLQ